MKSQKYAVVLTALQNAGAVEPGKGLNHGQIMQLTGLTGPQTSNALFQFKHRKAIGCEKVEVVPGLPRENRYWFIRVPVDKPRRRRAHKGNGIVQRAGAAFEVNISGPDLAIKRVVSANQVEKLVGWLIK